MPTKIISAALVGLDAAPVEVEADVARGLPNFIVVGLPDTAVQESRERVRTALRNAGLPFPKTRLTVNLAPADLRKEGPAYDLPIAVAILEAVGALPPGVGDGRLFIGELALDGSVRPVAGALPIALMAQAGGYRELYVPATNAREASLVRGLRVYPVTSIAVLLRHLLGQSEITARQADAPPDTDSTPSAQSVPHEDFADIRGQAYAKRALEIAAAGGHNILLSGPPGAGKTLLARAVPGILPPMTYEEMVEVTRIASACGPVSGSATEASGTSGRLRTARPFRAPHHTASGTAMIGGGTWPRPGEVTLAHRGVLFLDEFPEFPRSALENLRQPLEDGVITVARAHGKVTFPARFMLVAARNPCPCGHASDPDTACTCLPSRIAAYGRKLSGPLLDRIDLHVEVPKIGADELFAPAKEEPSSSVRARVTAARERQHARLSPYGLLTNADLGHALLRKLCPPDADGEKILRAAIPRLRLSARAVTRTLRLARTIADLDGAQQVTAAHVAEAVQYRERPISMAV